MLHHRLVLLVLATGACPGVILSADDHEPLTDESLSQAIRAPKWLKNHKFERNEFTFVRIRYSDQRSATVGGSRVRRGIWSVDYPDADLNLSALIDEMTSLKVNRKGMVLRLTDDRLAKYPFTYLAEPGHLVLTDEEVVALRKYLLGGGFLMVDDFWGELEWRNFYKQLKRVFPNREPCELPLEHPVFHCVFDFKEKPQVPSIAVALSGRSSERVDAEDVHYRGVFDDQGRLMLIICHNTDLADGWERLETSEFYTHEFSLKKAVPMGINIVFYAITQQTQKRQN